MLGNPPHLLFRFDTSNERLIVLPAFEETLDTYEIPKYYWKDKHHACRVCRLPFFLTLQLRFGWEDSRVYTVQGIFQILEERQKLVVFNFADTVDNGVSTREATQ
jgi:hypothetical protein